jgi:hypothetical protein
MALDAAAPPPPDRDRLTRILERERARFAAEHPRCVDLAARARESLLMGVPMPWMAKGRAEGTSFAAVLDDERRDLAAAWIDEGRLSRTEIAYLLGFSQPSSFSPAAGFRGKLHSSWAPPPGLHRLDEIAVDRRSVDPSQSKALGRRQIRFGARERGSQLAA